MTARCRKLKFEAHGGGRHRSVCGRSPAQAELSVSDTLQSLGPACDLAASGGYQGTADVDGDRGRAPIYTHPVQLRTPSKSGRTTAPPQLYWSLPTHCCLSRRQEGCHLCQRKRPVTFGQVRSARATRVGCRLAVFPVGAQSVSSSRYRVMRLRLLQDACWRRTPALPPPASKATWRPTSTPAPALRNEEGADHSRIRSLRARDPRRSAT